MSVEENIKGECEGNEEDGEDDESLHERLEDLHEHHHVDSKEVKPTAESTIIYADNICRDLVY